MTPDMTRRGLLIILSSPSGAGKSTLSRRLLDWDPSLRFSVSATTRTMLEHAHVFGNFYGSPRAPVEEAIGQGCDVLFDIDWQGAQQIRNSALGQHTLSVFILPPSIEELHRRLVTRGQDAPDVIAKRMQKSWDEISHWGSYDYVLVNDDLDATFERLKTIVTATRLRRLQQPWLVDHVRGLQTEFEELS